MSGGKAKQGLARSHLCAHVIEHVVDATELLVCEAAREGRPSAVVSGRHQLGGSSTHGRVLRERPLSNDAINFEMPSFWSRSQPSSSSTREAENTRFVHRAAACHSPENQFDASSDVPREACNLQQLTNDLLSRGARGGTWSSGPRHSALATTRAITPCKCR